MSRAKAKLATIHDLQSKQSDIILTKKDCDMICNALANTYSFSEMSDLYFWIKNLSKI